MYLRPPNVTPFGEVPHILKIYICIYMYTHMYRYAHMYLGPTNIIPFCEAPHAEKCDVDALVVQFAYAQDGSTLPSDQDLAECPRCRLATALTLQQRSNASVET